MRVHAADRRRLLHGHAGDHRHAAVQPVSERIPDRARGLRDRRTSWSARCSSCLDSACSPACCCTSAEWFWAQRSKRPRGWFPWRDTPLVILAAILVVIGFWLPGSSAGTDSRRGRGGEWVMTMDLFDELREQFPDLVSPSPAACQAGPRPDHASARSKPPTSRPVAEYLRSAYGSRLVTVFAEDRVAAEGVFYNYYVFEQPGEPCYLILQAPIPAGQPALPFAGRRTARRQLAGARDSGLVRPRSRRPSQSAPRRAARQLARRASAAQEIFRCDRSCRPSKASGTSIAPRSAKASSRSRSARCMPASSSPATSTSPSPASRSSTCNCACSTPTRAPRSCSKTCRFTAPCSWPRASRAIPPSRTAPRSARPSRAPRISKFRCAPASCAPSCWNWSASTITSPTSAPSPPTSASSWPTRMPAACAKWCCASMKA